jgi:hypothetical protein
VTPGATVTVVSAVLVIVALNAGYEPAFKQIVAPLAAAETAVAMLAPELSVVVHVCAKATSHDPSRIRRRGIPLERYIFMDFPLV